jgi:hypothetical protein
MNVPLIPLRTLLRALVLVALFALPSSAHASVRTWVDDLGSGAAALSPVQQLLVTGVDAGALPPGGSGPVFRARREDIFTRGASSLRMHVAVLPLAFRLPSPSPLTLHVADLDIPAQRDADLPIAPGRAPPVRRTYH